MILIISLRLKCYELEIKSNHHTILTLCYIETVKGYSLTQVHMEGFSILLMKKVKHKIKCKINFSFPPLLLITSFHSSMTDSPGRRGEKLGEVQVRLLAIGIGPIGPITDFSRCELNDDLGLRTGLIFYLTLNSEQLCTSLG